MAKGIAPSSPVLTPYIPNITALEITQRFKVAMPMQDGTYADRHMLYVLCQLCHEIDIGLRAQGEQD
jgi:hypothetical protein